MGNVIDLSGKRFGNWRVLSCAGRNKSGGAVWKCECSCGNVRIVDGRSLRSGASTNCGCLRPHVGKPKHSGRNERLYGVFRGMIDRCENKNCAQYERYGGRGITVCDEWRNDYSKFRDWALSSGYQSEADKYKCTIDRIDNNKGYSPENCRWVSQKAQSNNKGNNHLLTYNGETHTITEWSEITGIRKDTLRRRIEVYGWSIARALTEPNNHSHT